MIERPEEFTPESAEAGANWISVHQEACVHLDRTLHLIASHGCQPSVPITPATPVHTLDEVLPLVHHVLVMSVNPGFGGQCFIPSSLKKIELLSQIRQSRGFNFRIEVDGGVHRDTIANVVCAGAEILVAGSAILDDGRPPERGRPPPQSAPPAAKKP